MEYNTNEVKGMPDYREMYLTMMRETEKAIKILTDAQLECERLYVEAGNTPIKVLISEEMMEKEDAEHQSKDKK